MTEMIANTENRIITYEEFITEHHRKVSIFLNKVLWGMIVTGPFVLVCTLLDRKSVV